MDVTSLALGVDIGGTKVAVALVSGAGAVIGQGRGPVAPESNDAGLASVFRVVDEVLAAHPEARPRLVGIGAGAPGSIDWQAGVLKGASNLAWRHLPIAAALRERYGVPALLDNDVNVAAWGERCFGAGTAGAQSAASENVVFLTVGTGIGAGLIESGRLLRGRGGAGEIGHIPLFPDGPVCRCGMTGCLEAVASGPAFARAGQDAVAAGEAPGLLALAGGDPRAVTTPLVVRAAVAGDPGATRLLDREGYYLALAVLIAGRLLDPARVVLGGGLATAGAPLFEAVWSALARLRPRGPVPSMYVVPAALGDAAGAIGGAALILSPEPGFVAAGLSARARLPEAPMATGA